MTPQNEAASRIAAQEAENARLNIDLQHYREQTGLFPQHVADDLLSRIAAAEAATLAANERADRLEGAVTEAVIRLSSALLSGHAAIMQGEVRETRDALRAAIAPSPFEIGCRVRPHGALEPSKYVVGTLTEFNYEGTGALIRWDNGVEIWKALRNLEIVSTPSAPAAGEG